MRVALVACPAWAVWAPNPALLLLAAQLEGRGHEAGFFDMNIDAYRAFPEAARDWWLDENSSRWESEEQVAKLFGEQAGFVEEYAECIAAFKPDLVAFTINSGARMTTPIIARLVKNRLPEVPIVVGGADCFPSEMHAAHLIPGVTDALCPGEGDIAFPALVDAMQREGRIPTDQPGFLTFDGAEIRDNGEPERLVNLDELAPVSLKGIRLSKYTLPNRLTLCISRGCIRRCAFCSESPNFWRFRTHSPEWMAAQVALVLPALAESGQRPHINFNDSLINGDMKVLETFCDLIFERKLDFTWGGMAAMRPEMTAGLLSKMRKAGCLEICWGIESGSAKVLKLMRKSMQTPALMDRIIRETHRAGIEQYGNLIIGFPGEGPAEFAESLYFLVKNVDMLGNLGLPIYVPRKNSHVYDNPEKYSMQSLDHQEWTADEGRNNPSIRLLRRDLCARVLKEKFFDQGRYRELSDRMGQVLDREGARREFVEIFHGFIDLVRAAESGRNENERQATPESDEGGAEAAPEPLPVESASVTPGANPEAPKPRVSLWKSGKSGLWKRTGKTLWRENAEVRIKGDDLVCLGRDPFIFTGTLEDRLHGLGSVEITLRSKNEGSDTAQLFWRQEGHEDFSEDRSVRFVIQGGKVVSKRISLSTHRSWEPGRGLQRLRLDPAERAGRIKVEDIELF